MGSCEQILGRGCPDFALGAAGFSPFLRTAENDSKVFLCYRSMIH